MQRFTPPLPHSPPNTLAVPSNKMLSTLVRFAHENEYLWRREVLCLCVTEVLSRRFICHPILHPHIGVLPAGMYKACRLDWKGFCHSVCSASCSAQILLTRRPYLIFLNFSSHYPQSTCCVIKSRPGTACFVSDVTIGFQYWPRRLIKDGVAQPVCILFMW